ncbi:MAG: hypothetical protein IT305_22805 [Chloroflexi bacterium]|nr:hypothetical protein [Chloroflexota bacterium]
MAELVDGILFDSDALSLLGAAGLIPRTLAILGVSPSCAFRLEPLTHMLGQGRVGRAWPDEARANALRAVQQLPAWRHRPAPELLDRFVPVVEIDDGEAVLYASLVEFPSYRIVSGDKRAMIALCTAPDLSDVREAVAGRVICLESLLDGLVQAHGAATIGLAFAPVRSHTTIGIVFTTTNMADHAQCRFAISSYFHDLERSVGAGFLVQLHMTREP